jgi:glycosyltransferase involved in cell wall biosynthesis
MIDSPRQNRQMNALAREYDIYTIGIGPSPTHSKFHFDISYKPKFVFKNIDVFALPRVILYMFLTLFKLFALANYLLPTSGNTLSPRKIRRKIPAEHFKIVSGRDVHTLWTCMQVFSRELVWIDLPDFTPLEQEHRYLWLKTWGAYFEYSAQSLLSHKVITTTVSEGLAHRFEKDYGIKPCVLYNIPSNFEKQTAQLIQRSDSMRLVHSGAAIRSRDLHLMIEAVCNLNNVSLEMILLPTDKQYVNDLKHFSRDYKNISFKTPVERSQIISDLSKYHCALIVIAPNNFNYANCLPNKFFEAIQARIPVISGPTPDMKRIIEEYDIGIVASDFTSESIASAVRKMSHELFENNLIRFQSGLEKCASKFSILEQDKILKNLIEVSLSQLVPNDFFE